MKVACIGGGVVGGNAVLLLAKLVPDISITVFDAPPSIDFDRTFVLAGGTRERMLALGIWQELEPFANPLKKVRTEFAKTFGGLTLSGSDSLTDSFAWSVSEQKMRSFVHTQMSKLSCVKLINANVDKFDTNGSVYWQTNDNQHEEQFDLVLVAGASVQLLKQAGFNFHSKQYPLTAFVSNLSAQSEDIAYEQLLDSGATTLIPRIDGYSHILLVNNDEARELQAMSKEDYLSTLRSQYNLKISDDVEINYKASFPTSQRIAVFADNNKIVLLGQSACKLSPVGAQELNLGLRDCMVLARMLAELDNQDYGSFVTKYVQRRKQDRQRTAKFVNLATEVIARKFPCKLTSLGLVATAIDLCPPARRFVLGKAVWR